MRAGAAVPGWLKLYVLVSACAIAVLAWRQAQPVDRDAAFGRIRAERIDIVEADGTRKLVLSNQALLPDAVIAGETLPRSSRAPGILVYNEAGEEVGGWLFSATEKDGVPVAYSSLTFDQYQQDQTLQLVYNDEEGHRLVGLRIKDRPDIPAGEHQRRLQAAMAMAEGSAREQAIAPLRAPDRLFVGKSGEKAALWLLDPEGKPRIKLVVDGDGEPSMEFLDAEGTVLDRLPRVETGSSG